MPEKFLTPGTSIPDFSFTTPYGDVSTLHTYLRQAESKTALVFLRFYGCRLTKYDLLQYTEHYSEIAAQGRLLVVLQSTPEAIRTHADKGSLPFDIICDPTCALYDRFGVEEAADDTAAFRDPITAAKREAFLAAGIVGGDKEGRNLQMPAVFVLHPDGTLAVSRYGVSSGDSPTPAELIQLLK